MDATRNVRPSRRNRWGEESETAQTRPVQRNSGGGVFQPLPESNPGETSQQNQVNPPTTDNREEGNTPRNKVPSQAPPAPSENAHNTQTRVGNQVETRPENGGHQDESPERVVPVQTIRPTPQVQRDTRRNTMGTAQPQPTPTQERTPTNMHIQTPLIHPTTAGEGTTRATYRNLRRDRLVEDEISSRENVQRVGNTRRYTTTNQEQQEI